MHVDPTVLTDNEWAMAWQDLKWIREEERKRGFGELFNQLIGQ